MHNSDLDSSDLSLIPELESRPRASRRDRTPRPRINEVVIDPDDVDATFVEIHNPTPAPLALDGHFVSDDPSDLKKFPIAASTSLEAFGFLSLSAKQLGWSPVARDGVVFLALSAADGRRVFDVLRVAVDDGDDKDGETVGAEKDGGDAPRADETPKPVALRAGRFPDGGNDIVTVEPPTPGAVNRIATTRDLVFNEIMYHPISGDAADTYVEIFNRGERAIELSGFRVRGGIRYRFEDGVKLGAGDYLVVAKDPEALAKKYGLSKSVVVGPCRGELARRGERLLLVDPAGNPADSVEFADRDPWPVWADGLGSSLELRNPMLDNALPSSWSASDESSKSSWTHFRYRKAHRQFGNRTLDELQLMLLERGECLIDELKFGTRTNLIPEGSFERGAPEWRALGTHERSRVDRADAYRGKASYRIVAEGRGNSRHNSVGRTVRGVSPGTVYQVSFRARWVRGSRLLLTRLMGQGVAQTHELAIPKRLGSPGRPNSILENAAGPAVGTPKQTPIAPTSGEAVEFRVRVSTLEPIARATIVYRHDSASSWSEAPMAATGAPAGESVELAGHVPPQNAGIVEFHILVEDSEGRRGAFPRDAPVRTAQYPSGLIPNRKHPTYTLLVPAVEWDNLARRPRMSNKLGNATLVYGGSRIFYNVGFRRRGSPWTRSRYNWRVVFGARNLDGRRSLTVDGQGGDGTRLNERLTYWLLDQLRVPNPRQQYVYFQIPGREQGIYEDVEEIRSDFLERWFDVGGEKRGKPAEGGDRRTAPAAPARVAGQLHKVDDHFELFPSGGRTYEEAYLDYVSDDPEEYRWNFPPRSNGNREDFRPLIELLRFFDRQHTPEREFRQRLHDVIDVTTWLRVLAARSLVDDWDTLGMSRGKNAFLYLSPEDGRWRLLPWDCDLSWRDPTRALVSDKFKGVQRLVEANEREFLGYVEYLSRQKLGSAGLGQVLDDLNRQTGVSTRAFTGFAIARQAYVAAVVPPVPFRILDSKRVRAPEGPDTLRVLGTAPVIAVRFDLDGREGSVRFPDDKHFVVEFPVGPEGGPRTVRALSFGGGEVARGTVRVSEREGAAELPETPAVENLVFRRPESVARQPASGSGDGGGDRSEPAGSPEPEPGESPEVARGPAVPPPFRPVPGPREERRPGDVASLIIGADGEPAAPRRDTDAATPSVDPLEPGVGREDRVGAFEGDRDLGRATRGPRERVSGAPSARQPARPSRDATHDADEPRRGAGIPWALLGGSVVLVGVSLAALVILARARRSRAGAARVEAPPDTASSRPARIVRPRTDRGRERFAARARAAGPVTAAPAESPVAAALEDLAASEFAVAAAALARLNAVAARDVPALLRALGDNRPVPFQKVRGSKTGFEATPAEGQSAIRVRHIAALFLRRVLGQPPTPNPSPRDWQRLWDERRGRAT